jgi:hypothetical protein
MTDTYKIGGFGTDTISGRTSIHLASPIVGTVTSGTGYTFEYDAADYVVTAGKSFYPTEFDLYCNVAGDNQPVMITIVYADNSALTTNRVDIGSFATGFYGTVMMYANIPIGGIPSVPAGKYVGLWNYYGSATGGKQCFLKGYEE